jgi:hypothetical protein
MQNSIKRMALSLSLVASLCTPVWAAGASDAKVISAPVVSISLNQVPTAVTVDGKPVTFDQGPVMLEGVLYVPVRAIAAAGGGEVTWDSGIQLVHIRMPERTIMIGLSQMEAEMHQDGVTYLDRNFVAMGKMPVILAGRTLVSADALSSLFGFQVRTGDGGTLALTSPSKQPATPDGAAERGTITQAETGRILLSGAAMANGEARMTWASITDQTQILVSAGGKTAPGTVADLTVGAQVEVKWAGPLTLSYPASGAAAAILVLR